jgi:hypothetical protein
LFPITTTGKKQRSVRHGKETIGSEQRWVIPSWSTQTSIFLWLRACWTHGVAQKHKVCSGWYQRVAWFHNLKPYVVESPGKKCWKDVENRIVNVTVQTISKFSFPFSILVCTLHYSWCFFSSMVRSH